MYKHKNSFIVATTNIIVICLVPIIYELILKNTINPPLFNLVIFPLIIVFINIVLWFSKFKLKFEYHMLWAYVALFLSFIVSFVLIIDPTKEKPPGETLVVHADFLMIIYIAIVQWIVLLVLTGILYIVKVLFIKKNKKILEEGC